MCHGIRVVEIQHRQGRGMRKAFGAVGTHRDDMRIVGILGGLARLGTPHLDLRQVSVLETLDEHPVAVEELSDELVHRGLAQNLVLADLGQPPVRGHHHLEGPGVPVPP